MLMCIIGKAPSKLIKFNKLERKLIDPGRYFMFHFVLSLFYAVMQIEKNTSVGK
jgi:hypothetical protein